MIVVSALLATAPLRADGGAAHRTRQAPPVKMGTSGGSAADSSLFYCCGGTLGALVRRDGVVHILSNNHVLARTGLATTGEDDVQPGLIDSGCQSGSSNVVGDFAGNIVPLGTGNVDAALSVARTNVDATGSILDIGVPCSAVQPAAVGLAVEKSGRTTGLTRGTVQAVNVTVTVQYQRGCNTGRKFYVTYTNQVNITPGSFSAGGDSGSLIVSDDGSPNAVALLYAGSSSSTIGNPIQDVVNAFTAGGHSFSFVGTACGSFVQSAPIAGPSLAGLDAARLVKEDHESSLLGRRGVLGVGVGVSESDATQAAIVIFVDQSDPGAWQRLPSAIDGVPVRLIPTDPFVAR